MEALVFLFGFSVNTYRAQSYKYCVLSLIQIFKTNSVVQFPARESAARTTREFWDFICHQEAENDISSFDRTNQKSTLNGSFSTKSGRDIYRALLKNKHPSPYLVKNSSALARAIFSQ